MTKKKEEQSFIEKYGLQDKGQKVVISDETKKEVEALYRKSKRAIEAGADWAKNYKGKFG